VRLIAKTANDLIRILFEPPCVGCRKLLESPLTRPVCPECWRSIAPVTPPCCQVCGDELDGAAALHDACDRCNAHPPAYSLARSAGRYDGALRELLHTFKYEGRRQLAEPLGELLRHAARDVLDGVDAVVPVPLHPIRSLRRGFNQADDLARQLRRPVWRVLRRRRHGPSQTSLSGSSRRRNLRGEFGLSLRVGLAARRGRVLPGARLALIDDVMTTGATLDACAQVLVEAGVAEIRALTVGRAVSGRRYQLPEPPRLSTPPH
jgi:ComF family protein